MTLSQLLADVKLDTELPSTLASRDITGIDYDSRRIAPGNLFFAFAGAKADGRRFAADALAKGAVAVVSELPKPEDFEGPWLRVPHGRQALARAARTFYDTPDERLALTGITGTNGKTTTAYLIDAILRAAGKTTAMIGTIEYHLAGRVLKAANTTPESLDLMRLFRELEEAGGTHVTMEVSSHALKLARVYGLRFHAAVFTNLTRDHLDFHQTMEDYFASKQMLFAGAGGPPPPFAIINQDDPYGRQITLSPGTRTYWYGLGPNATVRARHIASGFQGLKFEVQSDHGKFVVQSSLIGKINVYNILAACCAGFSHGIDVDAIIAGVANCRAVPGRFERVDEGQPFTVVVDYAHTDDALKNVISIARGLSPQRIITIFGCGGDRDRAKRPLMGQVAAELSDFVIVTSDNPRSEDPLAIINDALVGVRRRDTRHLVEPDRHAAIHRAMMEARPGDIVIIAGKGHETYQILKDRTIPFDDRQVARDVLRSFGYRKEQS